MQSKRLTQALSTEDVSYPLPDICDADDFDRQETADDEVLPEL